VPWVSVILAIDKVTEQALLTLPHVEVKVQDVLDRNKESFNFARIRYHEESIWMPYAKRWVSGESWPDLYLDYDLTILDGNHRLCAAEFLKLDSIGAVVNPKIVPINTMLFPRPKYK